LFVDYNFFLKYGRPTNPESCGWSVKFNWVFSMMFLTLGSLGSHHLAKSFVFKQAFINK